MNQYSDFISYNKQRTDVTGFGFEDEKRSEDDIVIDNFRDGLYSLYKKDRETWNEDDKFLVKAVSDYLPLAVKKVIKEMELDIESFDLFQYAFVVPSEWEENIREEIIRPIFIQSGLISDQDHQDRLLFFSDIESFCYYEECFETGDNTILCRVTAEEEEIIVKYDLLHTTTTLFDIPNAKLYTKVISSSSVSVTAGEVEDRIKHFLRENLFPVAIADDNGDRELSESTFTPFVQNRIINLIMEGINSLRFFSLEEYVDEHEIAFERFTTDTYDDEEEPWISFDELWMLSEKQNEFINSLCPSIICAKIGAFLLGYMKDIISNNFTKSYKLLVLTGHDNDRNYKYKYDIKWLKYILKYNRRSLNSAVTIARVDLIANEFHSESIYIGAGKGVSEAILHYDMHCNPRIVAPAELDISSSVFLNSKPDAIINLDISLGSTMFSCSILDEDGLTQQIFDHDDFIGDKHLPPLGYFYTFSDRTTLNVKEQFIPFAEKYLLGGLSDLIVGDGVSIGKNIFIEMKTILGNDFTDGKVLISTDKQKYIKAFMLMYMIFIKEDILCKFPDQLVSDQMDMKIGYAVSIEAMLLNNTLESKDNLRDIIYASGLVLKDDDSKKLRITTQGEGVLPAIQKSLELELSLKSYFLLCQLHEDYVQLSLHQVVTEPSPEEEYQESIIVQDEIIPIQNIYDSLCSAMWYSLQQDNSLTKPCEIHNTSDNNKFLDILSSEIKTEFFANLKRYISDNVLQYNPDMRDTYTVKLTSSCNCKVRLATSDIIDVSFRPVLHDIACNLSASLLNNKLFGKYMNIDYIFNIIRFNNNPQLQHVFAKILEDEANDFNLERKNDTSCLVVPELFNQLLKPFIARQPFCFKDFKIGALQQVCNENYVLRMTRHENIWKNWKYGSQITDTKTIDPSLVTISPILRKGEIICNFQLNRKFYLPDLGKHSLLTFYTDLYKFKTMNYLEDNETLTLDNNIHQRLDSIGISYRNIFIYRIPYVPVMISVRYVSYTSSLQFFLKIVGADPRDEKLAAVYKIGEPLTLTRL